MKLKKIISTAAVMLTAVVLSACSVKFLSDEGPDVKDKAADKQKEVIECFEKEDKQALKDLFSKYVKENDKNLEKQIDNAFEFIQGKITSHGDTKPSKNGDDDNMEYSAYTQKVVTDAGKEYKITFEGWYECKKDTSKVGISSISIIDTSVEIDPTRTDKENGVYSIGIKGLH